MKRPSISAQIEDPSGENSVAIKKRASSLFSIATIVEDAFDCGSQCARSIVLNSAPMHKLEDKPALKAERTISLTEKEENSSPTIPISDGSTSDEDQTGIFMEDDDNKNESVIENSKSFIPNLMELEVPVAAVNQTIDDTKTGLVVESGAQHFDRYNRFHKERPVRVAAIVDALKRIPKDDDDDNDDDNTESLYDRCLVLEDDNISDLAATDFLNDEDYLRVHLPGYIQRLDKLSNCTCCDRLDREAEQYKSIYLTEHSVIEAKKAASSLCTLTEKVVTGELDNGFAVIRPPGHHAEPSLAGGYCLINNVAVATAYARAKLNVKKVLIVDWDVHHGNGTQSIFYNDPNVLYFSVHRWQGGNFYPFLPTGGPTHVGTGAGLGSNVNVGWSRKGMGDDEYRAVWDCLLLPMAHEFQPDLIMVSAGFDAAEGDLGECNVTPECFGDLTRSLLKLNTTMKNRRSFPVVCTLEGGYVRSVLGKCVSAVVRALRNGANSSERTSEPTRTPSIDCRLKKIDNSAAANIRSTIEAHRSYWKCFQ